MKANNKEHFFHIFTVIAIGITIFFIINLVINLASKEIQNKNPEQCDLSRTVERLDRGLVAIKTSDGVYISWRYFGTDSEDIGFNIYRNNVRINAEPIISSTNYIDEEGKETDKYSLCSIDAGVESDKSDYISVQKNQYFDINLDKPKDGVAAGESYTYMPNDASVADLDGDGEYEIILKWDPSNSKDNSESGYTGNVYIDAYKMDGTKLWRIDLGKNIRAGSHYTQFMVYDFDSDGFAEMVCKTADGTVDGIGTVIGDYSADYRNKDGYILEGPEYLTLFDGQTGAALDTITYEPGRGNVKAWGDNRGNRADRFLGTVAYLNGETPSVIMCRGYYTRSVLAAYDVLDKKLVERWIFDSNSLLNRSYSGQGFHNLATADADGDGYDEIVYGSACIDHNGKGLFNIRLGHGDALHVSDYDPDNPGLEAWGNFETGKYGAALWDLDQKGKIILRIKASEDNSRCIAGNFVSGNSFAELGLELDPALYTALGDKVCDWDDIGIGRMNFNIWWDGDLEQEILNDVYICKNGKVILNDDDVVSCNGTKQTPSLCADILGDWREEVIWPTKDGTKLRIYTTTIQTDYRIYTPMHNTQYRCQVAAQNTGYNMPAETDYFLGTGYPLPAQPNVTNLYGQK